jgi:hypothetical protein
MEGPLLRLLIRCFLPSFGSFGKAVSEEKIFLEIKHLETRIVCGEIWPPQAIPVSDWSISKNLLL